MKYIFIITFVFFTTSVFSQDFTHMTSKVAFGAGEMFANLQKCKAPEKVLTIFQESIQEVKNKAFPDKSYSSYIKLFDESYIKGKKSVLSGQSLDCNELLKKANSIILEHEKNS